MFGFGSSSNTANAGTNGTLKATLKTAAPANAAGAAGAAGAPANAAGAPAGAAGYGEGAMKKPAMMKKSFMGANMGVSNGSGGEGAAVGRSGMFGMKKAAAGRFGRPMPGGVKGMSGMAVAPPECECTLAYNDASMILDKQIQDVIMTAFPEQSGGFLGFGSRKFASKKMRMQGLNTVSFSELLANKLQPVADKIRESCQPPANSEHSDNSDSYQEGGRRRRSTRKGRKGRKGTRRH